MNITKKQKVKVIEHSQEQYESLEEIYDKFADELYGYALMILASHEFAEDAVQQVFLKLLKSNKWQNLKCCQDYLYIAVRNESLSILRKKQKAKNIFKVAKHLLVPVNEKQEYGREQKCLEQALQKLPPEQREVIHLKIYDNKTFAQIAALIGVSENTAASRYRYGLEKLKKLKNTVDHE